MLLLGCKWTSVQNAWRHDGEHNSGAASAIGTIRGALLVPNSPFPLRAVLVVAIIDFGSGGSSFFLAWTRWAAASMEQGAPEDVAGGADRNGGHDKTD